MEELDHDRMMCYLAMRVVDFGVVTGKPALGVDCESSGDGVGKASSDVVVWCLHLGNFRCG